jgi:YD repeat-containing protein
MYSFFYPKLRCLFAIFFMFPLFLGAQNNYLNSKQVILPSPNVAAIQRYGNWPLGSFTGTAPLNIPLFEVKSGELSFPVALSYNSGGVRINDVGSEVGVGWALNAGGVINRTMMGGQVDDNFNDGFWARYPITFAPADAFGEYYKVNLYTLGKLDAQPDLFTYNVAGMSGKFVFDYQKKIYQIPYTSNLIVPVLQNYINSVTGGEATNAIVSFTITDENGTQYQFATPELSVTTPYTYLNDNWPTPEPPDDFIHVSERYIFSWHLTNIISASKKDTISFVYEPVDTYYWTTGSSEIHVAKQIDGNAPPMIPPYLKSRTNLKNQVQAQQIKFIRFNGGYLQFYGNTDRRDMQQGKRLDSVVLYNAGNNKIKSYSFDYQYLYNTDLYADAQVPAAAQKEELRLMLRGIKEKGRDGSILPPYLFTYEHSKALPSRLMAGGDVWGFANGKVYQGIADSLFGRGYDGFYEYPKDLLRLKKPDYSYASQGSLTGIQYPTGGSTTFVYEPHFKEPTSEVNAVQICDGDINTNFTGVQFAPRIVNDPDAMPPPKFRVSVNNSGVDIITSLDSRYNNFPPYYYIEIRDSATNNLIYTYKNGSLFCDSYSSSPYPTCNKHLSLNIGTYYVYPKNTGQTYPGSAGDIFCNMKILPFNCHTEYVTTTDSIAVGGIRLKSVTDIDSVSGSKVLREFEYSNGVRPPWTGVYSFEKESWYLKSIPMEGAMSSVERERILSSSSLYPILDMMGGFIGYGTVKETQRDLNTGISNGYTISYFDNNIDDSPGAENYKIMPYPPFTGNSWTYGRLLRKSVYKGQGTGATLVKDEKKGYSPLKFKGALSGEAFFISKYIMPGSNYPFWSNDHHEYQLQEYFKHATFQYTSAYSVLDSTVVTTYDDNGRVNIVKEQYDYDTATILLKQTKRNNSKGDFTITNILRAPDYGNLSATDANTAGIKQLQQKHVYAPEIEISNFRANADGTNTRLLSSYFFSYRSDLPLKDKVYNLQGDVPITNFTASRNLSGAVTKDVRYTERLSFNNYDTMGNLTEQQKTNDVKECYLWGYGGLYPVARVIGADYDTARKYISPAILDNPTDDAQLRADLSNLRTKLPNALVTTYTYNLLLGMTSETDPSGKTIFYEYDTFGRLKVVKDQNGKILKQYDYQYKVPVTQ